MQPTADPLVTEHLSAMFGLLARAHLVDGPVSRPEYTLLALTAKRGAGRACDLADAVGLDQSTTSRRVSTLVERGFLARTPDPEDRRAQLVDLTPTGREVLEDERRRREELVGIALHDWSAADRATLAELLGRLQAALSEVAADHPVRSVAGPTTTTGTPVRERTPA
ncbi:winged helix-turn-helix transcriptional regulator [Phycicoccus sp. HDW14]|uniref:MarR family winged helix-turn-helix transcriptional regulator n=1 Tax=Phycicoccus sp. HDW14 TaxID=2714941 RepID=UPI00140CF53E|nr:MarR family winged helix-turn-helix transcriptional regulator [Phycicoccus sp. HDW14]QIM21672.1 winged helix-turn-helix transcriptional regulator [Phycicoccus sp. HDW14]